MLAVAVWCLTLLAAAGRGAGDASCGGAEPAPPPPGTFLYFAYGSNLWAKRLHIKNHSARLYSVAKLKGYRLDFAFWAETWRGAVATVVPEPGSDVWGALWTINNTDLANLDRQEGVDIGMYYAKNVTVRLPGCTHGLRARTYQETQDPPHLEPGADRPYDRLPSATYLNLIVHGAKECALPSDYVDFLKGFPNNGKTATLEMLKLLGSPFWNDPQSSNAESKPDGSCVNCEFVTTYLPELDETNTS